MTLATVEQPDICNLCGHALDPAAEFRYDDDSRVLIIRGRAFYFEFNHWVVLKAMLDGMGRAVRYAQFYSLLWGIDEPGNPKKSLEVAVCFLRKRLRRTGLWITCHRNVGYSIIFLAKGEVG